MARKQLRFDARKPSSESASRIKKKVRAKNTKAEILLRKELWRRGLRYRLHDPSLPGKPDLVFRSAKVAVFVDGDFWHGRAWSERKRRIRKGANPDYWIAKIESNMDRDRRKNNALREEGWLVVRVWESDVLKSVSRVSDQIQTQLMHGG
jgi:DNA mismatch endonuclease, patch repair protein